MTIKESRRPAFEQTVINRMKEGGFLEVEIRVECLARSGDGYYDGSVDAYWHFWNAALDGAPAQQVSAPMEADTVDAPWMSADTEPEIAWRDGFNACRARWLAATPAPAQQATDGGRNPRYEGLFEGETEEQRALRLAPVRQDSAKPAGWLDPDMALPCDVKLPGGMQISKGCKLSTLLISFRNRGDDVPWRQRFSVPVPYDPTLANIILELTAVDHLQTGIDSEAKP